MRPSTRNTLCIMGTLIGLASLACQSTTTGKSGELKFQYDTDDSIANFNKPIAKGALLDLKVFKAGSGLIKANVSAATPEDASVFEIDNTSGHVVTIKGVGVGESELSFQTDQGDDAIDMMVRVPEVLKAQHHCLAPSASNGVYIQGRDVAVPFDLELLDGQQVIGYGYYPMSFDDEGITLKPGAKRADFAQFDIGPEVEGEVVMSSDVDDKTLTFEVIKEADIDGVEAMVFAPIRVQDTDFVHLLPQFEGKHVCQAKVAMSVTPTSPDTCQVTLLPDDGIQSDLTLKYGWIEVKGIAKGDCTFDVSIPSANGGAGLIESLTLEVQGKLVEQ